MIMRQIREASDYASSANEVVSGWGEVSCTLESLC